MYEVLMPYVVIGCHNLDWDHNLCTNEFDPQISLPFIVFICMNIEHICPILPMFNIFNISLLISSSSNQRTSIFSGDNNKSILYWLETKQIYHLS